MSKYSLQAFEETWPIKGVFNIAHGSRTESSVVICKISDGKYTGLGESYPYNRYDETVDFVLSEINNYRDIVIANPTRQELLKIMPAGSARAAIDLALWDLESKQSGLAIWELANLPKPKPIDSAFTISIGTIDQIARDVKENIDKKILKLKLAGDNYDSARILKIRELSPKSKIIIDANESWSVDKYLELIDFCVKANVSMIEQPFPASSDDVLKDLKRPIAICADEACHTSEDLKGLVGKYDMINIKLDKSGGLTEALNLYQNARSLGFKIMVGCMVTTSLSIRPAYYLSQNADIVDIDGFALLAKDRINGLKFFNSQVFE
ncbi:MAG: dipeptide epimerase [Rickettsiales bacterium]|nr:dipeptide epimerase [Rickettsiales bacterium]